MFRRINPGAERLDQVLSTRHRASAAWRPAVLSVSALALVMTAAGPAAADYESVIYEVNTPSMIVESEGHDYTKVESGGTIKGKLTIKVSTGLIGRVEMWNAWTQIGTRDYTNSSSDGVKEWIAHEGKQKIYYKPRPRKVKETFHFSIPPNKYEKTVVQACKEHAQYLRQKGHLNKDIYSKNHSIEVAFGARLSASVSGPTGLEYDQTVPENWNEHALFNVTCKRNAPPPTPLKLEVAASKLSAEAVNAPNGQCALVLVGTVTPTLPHVPVKFRYVDDTGKKSDIKTVAPMPGQVEWLFTHGYPLDHVDDEKKGKIRIVGENADFQSDWAKYDMEDCYQAPGGFQTEQPPEIVGMQFMQPQGVVRLSNVSTTQTTTLGHANNGGGSAAGEYICPETVTVVAGVKGHSKMTGEARMHANAKQLFKGPYQVSEGQTLELPAIHEFTWNKNNVETGQEIAFRVVINNRTGNLIDTYSKKKTFKCERIVQGTLVLTPPKVTQIEAGARAEKFFFQNYTCPARVKVAGVVEGQGVFSGTALVAVNNQPVTEMPFTIQDGETRVFEGDQELFWNNQNVSGQKVWYRLVVLDNNKDVVDVSTASKTFKCDMVAGGKGVEIPASQPTNDKATAQAGLTFNIVAPKNRTRNGQIRLSGTKPDQVFKLRFLYKTSSSGFKIYNSPQLPKQMTGGTASFNLGALKAGTWRLRACPLKAGATIPKLKDCKSSDFQVQTIGTFQAPGGGPGGDTQPQTYSIIPGIGG